jgi:hypothetical protein
MMIPEASFIIYQPKDRIPSVFDLHERGLFKTRPYVTRDWSYRIIASDDLACKLQLYCLKEEAANDPKTGERYNFLVEKTLIDLDKELKLNSADIASHTPGQSITDEILASHDQWRTAYIPVNSKKKIDKNGLKKKLLSSITERKEIIRKDLIRKNSVWVNPAMPRLIQDFRGGLYLQVEDRLYEQYRQMGGTDDEKALTKKITLFQRVYDHDKEDPMRKPDGGTWRNEDEIWECWIGFAGSEEEAKRVCHTMEAVYRPLINEMAP